jgi:hypothetical protein
MGSLGEHMLSCPTRPGATGGNKRGSWGRIAAGLRKLGSEQKHELLRPIYTTALDTPRDAQPEACRISGAGSGAHTWGCTGNRHGFGPEPPLLPRRRSSHPRGGAKLATGAPRRADGARAFGAGRSPPRHCGGPSLGGCQRRHGCHLNRPIDGLIREAWFVIPELQTGYMGRPRVATFMYEGIAKPA